MSIDPDKLRQMLRELDEEERYLSQRGYGFPSLYEAIRLLLQEKQPD